MKTKYSPGQGSALAALLAIFPIVIHAQGTFIYDQQSSDETFVNGLAGIQPNQPIGQSFIPVLSSVGFIRLVLADENPNNGFGATLYVNLRSGGITGPVLSSTDPVMLPDSFGVGSNGFVNFFFQAPPTLTPGTTYY